MPIDWADAKVKMHERITTVSSDTFSHMNIEPDTKIAIKITKIQQLEYDNDLKNTLFVLWLWVG